MLSEDFLGETFLYKSKLCEENAVNVVINKITEDFEKIVAVTKLKELRRYVKNILPNYKKWKKLIKKVKNRKTNKQLLILSIKIRWRLIA